MASTTASSSSSSNASRVKRLAASPSDPSITAAAYHGGAVRLLQVTKASKTPQVIVENEAVCAKPDPASGSSTQNSQAVRALCWAGSDYLVAGCDDNSLVLLDGTTLKELGRKAGAHGDYVRCVQAATPAATSATTGDSSFALLSCGDDKRVCLWKVTLTAAAVDVEAGATSAPTAAAPPTVSWELQGEAPSDSHGHYVMSCAWAPGSSTTGGAPSDIVATGCLDGKVRLWSTSSGDVATLSGHEAGVNCVAFSPGGKHLISGADDKSIRVWNVATHECVAVAEAAHEHNVSDVACISTAAAGDAPWMAVSTGEDGAVAWWALQGGAKLVNLHKSVFGAPRTNPTTTGHSVAELAATVAKLQAEQLLAWMEKHAPLAQLAAGLRSAPMDGAEFARTIVLASDTLRHDTVLRLVGADHVSATMAALQAECAKAAPADSTSTSAASTTGGGAGGGAGADTTAGAAAADAATASSLGRGWCVLPTAVGSCYSVCVGTDNGLACIVEASA